MSTEPGPPETLRLLEVNEPLPEAGEALVRVEACGLNYPDVLMVDDRYQFRFERPFSPGIEIAGTVERVGDGVAAALVGARVVGQIDHGGLAELAIARADRLHRLPDMIPSHIAASTLLTYATSYHALTDRAALKAGETLLVLGGGGGVGLAAVELGKLMGAHVVAAVSSAEKAEAAAGAGADQVIIYPEGAAEERALSQLFKQACPAGANVIYDPIGGTYGRAALRAIAWEGRYLVVGFAGGIPQIPANHILLKGCQVVGVFWGSAAERDPDHARSTVQTLLNLMADGRIKPREPRLYPLDEAADALTALSARAAVGKLVVVPANKVEA